MTARAVSKHRRVCGQNYSQIPVLAQKKSPVTGMVTGLFTGAVGGIRTLVPLLTTTRFPVVLVMTSSIPLHIQFAAKHSIIYYIKLSPFVNSAKQKKAAIFIDLRSPTAHSIIFNNEDRRSAPMMIEKSGTIRLRDIPTDILIQLAKLYNTTTDYLLGLTDDPIIPWRQGGAAALCGRTGSTPAGCPPCRSSW